ncbi:MAG TPA: S-layer homology domain-containing protein [Candidatus Avoscillospira stercorigallinarum]|uniref:S-layer homology domain-containing protein n=1 Tax=Candidatus Avoscillospira stercorigallinarum TaxID=2840708 RepID=A0A9D0Z6E3_9FIRM|nr:S-layer homology domain-containing protein [Candidatus Avoscillospira stercorigallinarum]
MKNFRKVLALILVVATLFSFVAMVSAKDADDYSDYDKVNYAEAVDVLSAIGILDGYPDGTFRPTNTIKRSEMAKMIAVLSNAGDDVSDLYASACTFADAKNDWAASYIAYCAQTGIVSGRNATTFDPNGKVTGIETAKMLLCVLGFDAATQGYVGTNWKTNILRDAKDHGLLNGFAADYDPDKAITREEAAQMMLNALQANIVIGTISENLVKITNTIYFDRFGGHVSIPDAENEGWIVITRQNVVISPFPLGSIYKGLTLTADQDCYGNPGFSWVYRNAKGTVVFDKFYPTAADYSYTASASLKTDLKEEVDSSKAYTFNWYVDGRDMNGEIPLNNTTLATVQNHTGNGVETHVYVDDADAHVIITIKNTYIGEVTSVSNYEGTFKMNNTAAAFDNTGYGFKVGDVVLYWICSADSNYNGNSQLHDAKIAPVVTGACTRTEQDLTGGNGSTTKVGGETYEYAENFNNFYAPQPGVMTRFEVDASSDNGQEYDLYLDEFGYVMAWTNHSDSVEYVYAYAVEQTGVKIPGNIGYDGNRAYTYTNDLVTFDGKLTEDAAVNANLWNALNDRAGAAMAGYNRGRLLRYVDSNGVASIDNNNYWPYQNDVAATPGTPAVAGSDYADYITDPDYYLDADGDIMNDRTGNAVVNGTASTQYMVRTWNYSAKAYEYNVYTRDQLTVALAGFTYGNDEIDGIFAKMATIQYFYEEVAGVDQLTYVFIDALYQHSAQRAFVYSTAQKLVSDDLFVDQLQAGAYVTYKAIINGEDAILAVTDNALLSAGIPYLYEAELQVIGLVDGVTPVYSAVEDVNPDKIDGTRLWFQNGNLIAERTDSYIVADDCVVVVGDTAKDTYTKLEKVEDLNKYFEDTTSAGVPGSDNEYYDYNVYWLFFNDQGQVDEIFIVVDAHVVNGVIVPVD